MSKISRFKAALSKMLAVFGNVSTDKGVLAWDGDEDLKAGDAIYVEDQDGNRTPAPDGEYVTSDAKTIVVADGKVAEIKDPEAEVAPEPEAEPKVEMVQTDKGKLEWDNEDEDLKAGDAVYITDEDGNRNPAPDGDYTTEDGKVIVVVDGKVSEIKDPDAEVAARKEEFARIKAKFEESYDDKMRAIVAAIIADRGDGGEWYLITAGDDFAVVAVWGEEGDKFYRYSITWNEDGTANATNPIEVKEMFVPVDFKDPFADGGEAEKEAEELRAQVQTLTRKIEEMSRMSAAKSAHEEVKTSGETEKTGIKGHDRLSRYVDAMK